MHGTTSQDLSGLQKIAVRLAWFTVAWNFLEAVVAITEGAARNSSALIGFGLDSTIEVSSALIVLWQFRAPIPADRERQALRMIAISFFALAAWVVASSLRDLIDRSAPEASSLGIALAIASLIVMPLRSSAPGARWALPPARRQCANVVVRVAFCCACLLYTSDAADD